MTAAFLNLGRLEGVQRPAIAIPIPHQTGMTIVLDAGANVDCRPSQLAQFAVMGEVYSEQIMGIQRPRIGLLNVGEEEGKGNELAQDAYEILRKLHFNFIGNVEGNDLVNGRVDVVVCDGFVGNIILKFAESMIEGLFKWIRDSYKEGGLLIKVGALLSKPVFRGILRKIDPAGFGGAPLLGVNGNCIIGHGGASARAVKNSIAVAQKVISQRTNSQMRERLRSMGLVRGGHG